MPYNTRRKSLSLPSLGIHLPNGSRSHRSPSAPKVPSTTDIQPPPSKKAKRSHDSGSPSPVSASSETEATRVKVERSSPKGRGTGPFEHTPPPSPADVTIAATKVDTDGINDDIVVAVIEQLEKTGNRPHLIKELATVISNTNEIVANSANSAALLSSRLSLYMKRPWTALAPCPIGKEMLPVHPRKVFFYLTTCPHQPLPEASDGMITPTTEPKRLTPSLSSASVDLDGVDEVLARERARISLSPEIDLSAEFDEDDNVDFIDHSASAPTGNFGGRNDLNRIHSHRSSHNHRSASPPLEGDEREFTQTATSVRERTSSEELALKLRQDLDKGDSLKENESASPRGNEGAEMDRDPSTGGQSSSQENGYDDYYSAHVGNDDQTHDLDSEAVTALFGTSPSPSASSEASLSSDSSATSDGETEITLKLTEKSTVSADLPADLLSSNSDITPTIGRGISSTRVGLSEAGSIAGTKRTISMLETTSPEDDSPSNVNPRVVDSDMEIPLDMAAAADPAIVEPSYFAVGDKTPFGKPGMGLTMSFDISMESWNDLRSPETIEVDELDEIFAGI